MDMALYERALVVQRTSSLHDSAAIAATNDELAALTAFVEQQCATHDNDNDDDNNQYQTTKQQNDDSERTENDSIGIITIFSLSFFFLDDCDREQLDVGAKEQRRRKVVRAENWR